MQLKKYYLICYDIEETKKRNKLAKWLKNYGLRVQKSVFEAYLSQEDVDTMIEGSKQWISMNDSLRIYELSKSAYNNKVIIGTDFSYNPSEDVII